MKELEALQFYLPAVVAQHISESERDANGLFRPSTQHFDEIVCLFADMSGFTSLTERLCSMGPDGLEDLSANLNKFVTQLVKTVSKSGGDVLKFAGDAVMALWPEIDPNDYQLRVQRAVQCAMDIQLRLDKFVFNVYEKDFEFRDIEAPADSKGSKKDEFILRAKLGLGSGRLNIMHLGGHGDLIQRERLEYVALGPALMEAIESENNAKPGEVVVSSEIWKMVGDYFIMGKKLPTNRIVVKEWRPESRVTWKTYDRSIRGGSETERKLWKYVPNAVMPYLLETNDEFWAPELRTVTTLFFNLGLDIPELSNGKKTDKLADVFYEIQGVVLSYEGTINKFLVDDKGATLIAVFGLPPFSHENDPLRGVLSGLKVLYSLYKHDLQGAVGISTGLAFCGIIGHATGNRREYSVIGDSVNLAARLMQKAREKKCSILIDRTTKQRLQTTSLDFISGTISVKGKRDPVQCYQISSKSDHSYRSVQLARLGELGQYNVVMLGKNKPKSRRRATRTAVSNPNEMKALELEQVKAMNDTSRFFQRKRAAKARLQAITTAHDAALITANQHFQSGHSRSSSDAISDFVDVAPDDESNDAEDDVALARIKYRHKTDEVETTIAVSESRMNTIQDLTSAAIASLINKGFIEPSADDSAYYDLLWVRDAERVTLKPDRLLSSLPFSNMDVLTMILVRFDTRRDMPSFNTPDPHGVEHIRERLAAFQEEVFAGNGSRLVILEGEHGVGKTYLVENFFLSREGSAYDEGEAIFAYARGNPFEVGRQARPFAIWTQLMEELLEPPNAVEASNTTREMYITDAIKTARRIYGTELVPEAMDGRLHLLNRILNTRFPRPGDESPVTANPARPDPLPVTPKQTKKNRGMTKTKNILGADGKVTRVKALSVLWGSTDENSGSTRSHSESVTSPTLTSSAPGILSRLSKRASMLQRLSRRSGSASSSIEAFVADPDVRSIIRILAAVLGGVATRTPLTIVVDESQYLDTFSLLVFQELTESWSRSNMFMILLRRLTRIERSVLLQTDNATLYNAHQRVSMFRPPPVKMHSTLKSHLQARTSQTDELESSSMLHERLKMLDGVIQLELISRPRNTYDIVRNFSNVERVPTELIEFLAQKTKGNPLYIVDAISHYTDIGLIVRSSTPEPSLSFAGDEFDRLLNIHQVPIPLSVDAIVGSLVDKMTLIQQLIIKVAVIIGDVFTRQIIREIFPVATMGKEMVSHNFDELVASGVIVFEKSDQGLFGQTQDPDTIRYTFESGWMVEIMRHRMLNKQKLKLNTKKKRWQKQIDEQQKLDHLRKAKGKLEIDHSGFLQVRKENARNIMNPWKPRWCRLRGHELIQFHDRDETKRLEVIILDQTSEVSIDPIGFFGIESKLSPGAGPPALHCFTIRTNRWEKKGKIRVNARSFTLGCEDPEDRVQWVFKVQYQIDLLKIQAQDDDVDKKDPAGSMRDIYGQPSIVKSHRFSMSSTPDAIHSHGLDEDAPHPLIAPEPPGRSRGTKGSMLKTVFGSRSSDTNKGFLKPKKKSGTELKSNVQYGCDICLMTPEAFAEISKPENLMLFWSETDGPGNSRQSVKQIPMHSSEMYYECAEMSLVSYNSNGEIDGYLMGKLRTYRRNQVIGLVTACGVLPWARRLGIGHKLYAKFFALCRGKGCRFVRCNVERAQPIAISFHRSLMFDEDEDQTNFLARAGDDGKICFIKDLDTSSKDEELVEYVNPLHVKRTSSTSS